MKKIITAVPVLLFIISVLCSCGGKSAKPLSEIFSQIKSEVGFSDFLEYSSVTDLKKHYGIAAEQAEEFAGGINKTGVNQEEIVLVKAASEKDVDSIKTALDNRYKAKLNQNKNYNAEQADMIEKCSVEVDGLYVSMIVSENAESITKIYKEGIKG